MFMLMRKYPLIKKSLGFRFVSAIRNSAARKDEYILEQIQNTVPTKKYSTIFLLNRRLLKVSNDTKFGLK